MTLSTAFFFDGVQTPLVHTMLDVAAVEIVTAACARHSAVADSIAAAKANARAKRRAGNGVILDLYSQLDTLAFPVTSAGRFRPWGPLGMGIVLQPNSGMEIPPMHNQVSHRVFAAAYRWSLVASVLGYFSSACRPNGTGLSIGSSDSS